MSFYGAVYLHLKGSVGHWFEHPGCLAVAKNSLLTGRNLEGVAGGSAASKCSHRDDSKSHFCLQCLLGKEIIGSSWMKNLLSQLIGNYVALFVQG